MRDVPTSMSDAWVSGDFTGDQRPVTRVTIQVATMATYPVEDDVFSSVIFADGNRYAMELPNIRSCNWERGVDSDTASCTMEFWNTKPLVPGSLPDLDNNFDQLGIYTYNRGQSSYSQSTWGHAVNEWQDVLIPDRVIRTYQGYGCDYTVVPELDPHLVLTGVWLIDDVTYTADGIITVECRDMARLLLDQIVLPPVIPTSKYPLSFEPYHEVDNPDSTVVTGEWRYPTYRTSSNFPYIGDAFVIGGVGADTTDANDANKWVSVGNTYANGGGAYEWIEYVVPNDTVNAVKLKVWGGPYKVYLSIKLGNVWQGALRIPYKPSEDEQTIKNGSDIFYVNTAIVPKEGEYIWSFNRHYNVTAYRLTFTNLYNSGIGYPYVYRAGLYHTQYAGIVSTVVDNGTHQEGNFGDYCDIVKYFLACGGFYWPPSARQKLTTSGGTSNEWVVSPSGNDPYLGTGEVWGDIQMANTASQTALGVEIWDKKSLMDGINYVKDVLGYNFFVDEQGAAIFRSPNTFQLGNWNTNVNGLFSARTSAYIDIDDDQTLIGLRSTLSSRNAKEKVFVSNISGGFGAVVRGRMPYEVGFRRVGGWTDQNFASSDECRVMAELITIRQLFTYHRNSVRIPAYPKIQVDDQIRIHERTTGEQYYHYVSAISSSWEAETGVWTYDLTTSWLGSAPGPGTWAFDINELDPATQEYLQELGAI